MKRASMARHECEPEVSVVVPLFNEQENLSELHRRLTGALGLLSVEYELVLVDDGSCDATSAMLDEISAGDPHATVIHLSRNFGHQPAICAGIDVAQGKAVIIMDGDLQDPPEALDQFIQKWRQGFDVVYAVRTKRKEGILKRAGYFVFYRLMRSISDLDIPLDSGDFCLLDRKVVDALKRLPERQRFVRGLRSFVGFKQVGLQYERAAREAGTPKYKFRNLLDLALQGLIGFSVLPLNCIFFIGTLAMLVTLLLMGWLAVSGKPHLDVNVGTLALLFMGSTQLIATGILAQYLRLTFLEVKARPTYLIREIRRQREPAFDRVRIREPIAYVTSPEIG